MHEKCVFRLFLIFALRGDKWYNIKMRDDDMKE